MLDVRERLADPDLPQRVRRLGFRDEDAAAVLALIGGVADDEADTARVGRLAERLRAGIGHFDPIVDAFRGADPRDDRRAAGLLPLLSLLVTAPEVVAFHGARAVPEETSWRSLSDLGQQVWVHRLTYGGFGLHTHGWLCTVWAGGFFWLGRLQFNFRRARGAWWLSTHIPRTGPLAPDGVDDAFAAAAGFAARHFPDLPVRGFHCASWLLDPELAAALPAESNLARFQRRWRLSGEAVPGDADALFFTFNRRGSVDLETLPHDTTLQRVLVSRLRTGGHWQIREGFIERPAAAR